MIQEFDDFLPESTTNESENFGDNRGPTVWISEIDPFYVYKREEFRFPILYRLNAFENMYSIGQWLLKFLAFESTILI